MRIAASLLCFALSTFTLQAANILQNGSFETGDFTGWAVTPNPPGDHLVIYGAPRATHGLFGADFNFNSSDATALLSQTFATSGGQLYGVSFDFGVVALGGREGRVQFQILGYDGVTVLLSQVMSVTSWTGESPVRWATYTGQFTADGSSAQIRFQDLTPDSFANDPVLDNVQVNASEVPEPAAIALVCAGLGALVVRRRV